MALAAGTRLGPYEILEPLGAGGMGEVYRARDTKLGRDVAIKTLPPEVTGDSERLARLQREAHLLASLNHPHIAAIYGLEEADGNPFLVLELVEGEDLQQRLERGPIPLDEALEIAKQIAEGLEAAHEKGIVHRDLKPANVKLTPDEKVKVLDFGLAKAWEGDPISGSSSDQSRSPTLALSGTQAGVILGTAAYMSPEQARGKPVDKRADIWAFGCVLYEMLTARRTFEGEDVSVTLAEVIKSEPDFDTLPGDAPARVRQALRVCLQKDPRRRGGDIAAIRLALDGVFETGPGAPAAQGSERPVWRRALPWAAAAVVAAITGLAVWMATRPEPPRVARFYLSPEDISYGGWWGGASVALSPDGETVAYVWRDAGGQAELRVRPLNSLAPTTLVSDGHPRSPFFSPDGSQVGFNDRRADELQRVPVGGGPVARIASLPGGMQGGSWGDDGTIVFALNDLGADTALWRVPAAGGTPERLTTPDVAAGEQAHLWPELLPGSQAVLFVIEAHPRQDSQVALLSLETGEEKILLRGGTYVRYSPTGHLLYGAAGILSAVGFDVSRLETVGRPVPVIEGVQTLRRGAMGVDLSDSGSLVFVEGDDTVPLRSPHSWVWVDRQGREETIDIPPSPYHNPSLSPDGVKLASATQFLAEGGMTTQIVVLDLETGASNQLTFEGVFNANPVWSPDGTQLTYASNRGERTDLYRKPADGSGPAEKLLDREGGQGPGSHSPDGRYVVFQERTAGTQRSIHIFSTEDGTTSPFVASEADVSSPAFSPDGRFIAYTSNESGSREVYVQPFPRTGAKWKISTGGGRGPRWSRASKELFYQQGDELIAVEYEDAPSFEPRSQTVLFSGDYESNPNFPTYDVHPDGQRFLFPKIVEEDVDGPPERLVYIQNFAEELKRLVPAQ